MRSTKLGVLICTCLFIGQLRSQEAERPKILIGIVVDQMRYDYLQRFEAAFGEDGFKRFMKEGMHFNSMHCNYKPTKTAAGHASIYTGTTPSVHGIVANNWYSREEQDYVYCVKLPTADEESIYSPARMQTTTLADEMKLSLGKDAKSFAVSLKDRGAILPAGHMADGAYWFEGDQGGFISSAYYQDAVPKWVENFNEQNYYENYLADGWKLSQPEKVYEKLKDDRKYERAYQKGDKVTFPYDFEGYHQERGDELIKNTPFGNQLLADFAMELIKNEALGKDTQPDFFSISFSSTDYIGHQFGVGSREVMDAYLRLDKTLAELLSFFDKEFGDDYVVFLSSDHGAAENRNQLKDNGVPAGYFNRRAIAKALDLELDKQFGEADWIISTINLNVYLNRSLFQNETLDVERDDVIEAAYYFLKEQEGVLDVFVPEFGAGDEFLMGMTASGYFPKESGDLIMIEKSNWNASPEQGSTHSSAYAYDTHIPFCIMGKGIERGEVAEPYAITDIAPALARFLGISLPDGVREYRTIHLK